MGVSDLQGLYKELYTKKSLDKKYKDKKRFQRLRAAIKDKKKQNSGK